MPRITVGVDAGGTSTVVAVAVDGTLLREHEGPPANASVLGAEAAGEVLTESIVAALDGARPHALFVGAAGAGRDEVADSLRTTLAARFEGANVDVADDAHIALRSAIPDGDGVVLIAGTGSIAYAIRGTERTRCGGYGYLLGDEGSGFALGAAALRFLLRSYDGRVPRDAFVETLERATGTNEAAAVLRAVYGSENPVREVAALAPVVLAAANAGERSANKIVQSAALELADLVKSVVRRSNVDTTATPLAFAGGLLRENSLLTFLLETRLQNDLPGMPIVKSADPPYVGALRCAQALLA